jgi:membrane protein implicated in regulation of membrane protease activity
MGEMELGGRFWLGLLGICAGAVVAGAILFLLFGWAWSAFGFIGALIVLGALAVGFAYVHDRREQKRYQRPAA